jgi:hypothetical protein
MWPRRASHDAKARTLLWLPRLVAGPRWAIVNDQTSRVLDAELGDGSAVVENLVKLCRS